jgi:predicted nucleic acid-binding protein
VTSAETRFGIEVIADDHQRATPNAGLSLRTTPMLENKALSVTEDITVKWRLLVEQGRKTGHTFTQPDLIVPAMTLHHGLTVVPRDASGYEEAGVSLVDCWSQQ